MQVMEELQGVKEEEPAAEDTAMVAAGLEGAGPSLDIDEELRILEDEAQVSSPPATCSISLFGTWRYWNENDLAMMTDCVEIL